MIGIKADVLTAVAKNANATLDVLQEVIEVAKGMKDGWAKSSTLRGVGGNPKVTTKVLKSVIEATKEMKDETSKTILLIEVASNGNAAANTIQLDEAGQKDFVQELLFASYNCNSNNINSFKGLLKDLINNNDHLDKAYQAMRYVSGGKELTADNKSTLTKSSSTWEKLVDAICHYIWKTVTLGFGTTQKESRDNFNSVVSYVEKIKNERAALPAISPIQK